MKRIVALAATAVLLVALVACGGSVTGGGSGDTAQSLSEQAQFNPQPYENIRDGGTLTTALPEITPQFNTWQGDGTLYTLMVWRWYNPILITFTADGDAVYNPDYLNDVKQELVDGNTRITYTINPKATYNDGTPIDWRSFEAVWKTNGATNPAYIFDSSDGYDRIASVTRGVNDRQAVVTFRGVNLWWQSLYNNLIHPNAVDPQVYNQGYIDNPHPEWGAGPYQIQNFDKQNRIITFVRNPKWWGKPGKLDSRTFLTMEPTASINAFKNGQLDATSVATKDRLAQVQGMTGIEIRKSIEPALDFFTLNGQSPILADPAVRKAVFEGIDRRQLQEIEFQGLNLTAQLPGSMVLLPFQDGYQDNLSKVITFNPEQAKQGLQAAGWTPDPDGIRVKDGKPLEFTYVNTGDDPVGKAVAGATAAMLKNIGVRLNIRQVPSSEYSAIVTGKRFDMFYSGVTQTDPYGIAYICQLYCSDSTLLKSGVNSPTLDAQLRTINQLPTPQEQYAKANEVETEAFKTYGTMPTISRPAIVATKQGLANFGAGRFFVATPETIGWQK
ncbi:MAG: ABC transporter family substrate-binding protein [Actinomycetota bacterium]|nr:ABC transporter family substrate-binding protein [Actinomycetota bacterium]